MQEYIHKIFSTKFFNIKKKILYSSKIASESNQLVTRYTDKELTTNNNRGFNQIFKKI